LLDALRESAPTLSSFSRKTSLQLSLNPLARTTFVAATAAARSVSVQVGRDAETVRGGAITAGSLGTVTPDSNSPGHVLLGA
jgi:hypothetical protein